MSNNPKRKADGKFARGQSGNPAGRPKSNAVQTTADDFDQIFRKVLYRKLPRPTADGKVEVITRLELLIEKLLKEALKGDVRAMEKIFNVLRVRGGAGKPAPSLESLQELLEDDVAILENHNAKLRRAEAEPITPTPIESSVEEPGHE